MPLNLNWVLVEGFNLSYHNKGNIYYTIGLYYGNLYGNLN